MVFKLEETFIYPKITLYVKKNKTKNTYEVIKMKDKQSKDTIDKNFFKAMSYEFAGEIGVVDNEEMKNNVGISSDKDEKKLKEDKK
jgi:hypothetical protein